MLDAIEEALVSSDMGVDTTLKIIDSLESRVKSDKYMSLDELADMLRDEIGELLNVGGEISSAEPFDLTKKPLVVMVVGVNGVGKTTTIGKLAARYKAQGKKVILGAADTFRAAAVDQLQIWADRAGVDIVRQNQGSDPASVAYDTVSSAVAKNADVVLIDTAGRLHNRVDLMNELTKIRNVMRKVIPDARPECLPTSQGILQGNRHHFACDHEAGRHRQRGRGNRHCGPAESTREIHRNWRGDRRPEAFRQKGVRDVAFLHRGFERIGILKFNEI